MKDRVKTTYGILENKKSNQILNAIFCWGLSEILLCLDGSVRTEVRVGVSVGTETLGLKQESMRRIIERR